ncbi:MAG: hypothetical protein ACFFAY_14795 [Promethearchaeota archaeon]
MSVSRIHRLGLIAVLGFFLTAKPIAACTIFMGSLNGTVLFGNNEDWYPVDTYVTFAPGQGEDFGVVYCGTGTWYAEGGMNEAGLCYDAAAIPEVEMNPHSEKPNPLDWPPILMLEECLNVSEAIALFEYYNWETTIAWQLLVADRNGDSAVFAPGADGEWNYTMRENAFQVVTNFNLAMYPDYTGDSRYNTATSMLSTMGDNLSLEYFTETLDAVHNPGYSGVETIYSNVYDLVNGEMYLFYLHDFSQYIRFNLTEELEQGYHRYHIESLFDIFTTISSTTTTATSATPTTSTPAITETPDFTLPLLGAAIGAGALVGIVALTLVWRKS